MTSVPSSLAFIPRKDGAFHSVFLLYRAPYIYLEIDTVVYVYVVWSDSRRVSVEIDSW